MKRIGRDQVNKNMTIYVFEQILIQCMLYSYIQDQKKYIYISLVLEEYSTSTTIDSFEEEKEQLTAHI